MKYTPTQIKASLLLLTLSVLGYLIHFIIFRDPHHIFIFLVSDIAFVFIEVLLVTLIIHQALEHRELAERIEKLNMIVGIFFSEMGTQLLSAFSDIDPSIDDIKNDLVPQIDWTSKDFTNIQKRLVRYQFRTNPTVDDLVLLKSYFAENRSFLLSVMANPNLMEHESFTELLRTLLHVCEELKFRDKFDDCTPDDIGHMAGDIDRAYAHLVREWINYMEHLKGNFPYLFSLSMRTNPFDKEASVKISA